MPQIINTNIMSLNAQRNLNRSQDSMRVALQRLSSGLRINSAKDDAAGLAISERFTTQIRGLTQATRNANDGVSLAQVAEGALDELNNIMQRIRELAVQSVNATNSAKDRLALQNEVGQLTAELNRIARTTQFNGQNIFDGTFSTQLFQVGHQPYDYIVATTANFKTQQYGDYRITGFGSWVSANGTHYSNNANNSIIIAGVQGTKTISWSSITTAGEAAEKINLFKDNTGVTASAITEADVTFSSSGSYRLDLKGDNRTSAVTVGFSITAATGVEALSAAATAFNDVQSKTGVVATVKSDGSGLRITHFTGENITLADTTFSNTGNVIVNGTNTAGSTQTLTANTTANTAHITGQIIFDSDRSFTVQGVAAGSLIISAAAEAATLQKVSDFDISTTTGAILAISVADAAISQLTAQRAKFGALQARFESTIRNLQTTTENLSAARSRTRDADFAVETAELTRTQILQQAGTAMLAQANSIPQNVLTLLK